MQQITHKMLFGRFVGLAMKAAALDATVLTENRDRLSEGDIACEFLATALAGPRVKPLLATEHFSVDGTLIEVWTSMKSFRPKDGSGEPPTLRRNREQDLNGEKRSNETHGSIAAPAARLHKKSSARSSTRCHMGHVVMENRNGLVVATEMTPATGTGERERASAMDEDSASGGHVTLGVDKAYDTLDFVAAMRRQSVTPHVTQSGKHLRRPIDGRTARHGGCRVRRRRRKRTEEVFSWTKTMNSLRKTRHRGTVQVGRMLIFTAAAYNLVWNQKLLANTV